MIQSNAEYLGNGEKGIEQEIINEYGVLTEDSLSSFINAHSEIPGFFFTSLWSKVRKEDLK